MQNTSPAHLEITFVPSVEKLVEEALFAEHAFLDECFRNKRASKSARIKNAFERILPSLQREIGKYLKITDSQSKKSEKSEDEIRSAILQDMYIINIAEYQDLRQVLEKEVFAPADALEKFHKVVASVIRIKTSLYKHAHNLDRKRSALPSGGTYVEALQQAFRCQQEYMVFSQEVLQLVCDIKRVLWRFVPYERLRTPSSGEIGYRLKEKGVHAAIEELKGRIYDPAVSLDQKINEFELAKGMLRHKREIYNERHNRSGWAETVLQIFIAAGHRRIPPEKKEMLLHHLSWCIQNKDVVHTEEVCTGYAAAAEFVKQCWEETKEDLEAVVDPGPRGATHSSQESNSDLHLSKPLVAGTSPLSARDTSQVSSPSALICVVDPTDPSALGVPDNVPFTYRSDAGVNVMHHLRGACGWSFITMSVIYGIWHVSTAMKEKGPEKVLHTLGWAIWSLFMKIEWMCILSAGVAVLGTNAKPVVFAEESGPSIPSIRSLILVCVSAVLGGCLWSVVPSERCPEVVWGVVCTAVTVLAAQTVFLLIKTHYLISLFGTHLRAKCAIGANVCAGCLSALCMMGQKAGVV